MADLDAQILEVAREGVRDFGMQLPLSEEGLVDFVAESSRYDKEVRKLMKGRIARLVDRGCLVYGQDGIEVTRKGILRLDSGSPHNRMKRWAWTSLCVIVTAVVSSFATAVFDGLPFSAFF